MRQRLLRAFADRLTEAADADAGALGGPPRLADWLEWARARGERLEKRALTSILTRPHDISGKSELTARFGWAAKPSSANLLSVLFNPYENGSEVLTSDK